MQYQVNPARAFRNVLWKRECAQTGGQTTSHVDAITPIKKFYLTVSKPPLLALVICFRKMTQMKAPPQALGGKEDYLLSR